MRGIGAGVDYGPRRDIDSQPADYVADTVLGDR
jgi:hypothetical protein